MTVPGFRKRESGAGRGRPPRILFVGLPQSIHTARWISQLSETGWDLHLFAVNNSPAHQQLEGVTVHRHRKPLQGHPGLRERVVYAPVATGSNRFLDMVETLCPSTAEPATQLARTIRRLRPTVVHALGIQHGGYVTRQAIDRLSPGRRPPWILSTWGSDICFYRHLPEHEEKIRKVLSSCSGLFSDCPRDAKLACMMGFSGQVLGVIPGGGGYRAEAIQQWPECRIPPSQRMQILLKGYHDDDSHGRALVALEAIDRCARELYQISVAIYSASPVVQHAATYVRQATGLQVHCLPRMDHEELLREAARSRISISVNVTDGLPNAFLEALLTGAFPIQSRGADVSGWMTDGKTGWLVPHDDARAISHALRWVLQHPREIDAAADQNMKRSARRLDTELIRQKVIAAYRRLWERLPCGDGVRTSHPSLSAHECEPRKEL